MECRDCCIVGDDNNVGLYSPDVNFFQEDESGEHFSPILSEPAVSQQNSGTRGLTIATSKVTAHPHKKSCGTSIIKLSDISFFLFPDLELTSRVPVERKSSVCLICMKYRYIFLIIIISLGQILLSDMANTSRTQARTHS